MVINISFKVVYQGKAKQTNISLQLILPIYYLKLNPGFLSYKEVVYFLMLSKLPVQSIIF